MIRRMAFWVASRLAIKFCGAKVTQYSKSWQTGVRQERIYYTWHFAIERRVRE